MADANIPDIKHRDVHEHFLDKFRLDLSEEDAIKHFESLLPTSYFTAMLDMVHHWAQCVFYIRNFKSLNLSGVLITDTVLRYWRA
jgi:hypothetical protein